MPSRITAWTTCAATAALAAVPVADAAGQRRTATLRPPANCQPITNVQAIIDDSGSNQQTDPAGLRRNAMLLLLGKEHNADMTLGAVEFGTEALRLFQPQVIGSQAGMMADQINSKVISDGSPGFAAPPGGGTDYNAAFALATSENPNAQARIFLTDGAHNEGAYQLGHRQAPARTFVLGLSIGAPAAPLGDPAADTPEQRLQRIATETKGRYFPNLRSGTLQETVNTIDAALNCGSRPATFPEFFFRQGQAGPPRTVKTTKAARRFDLVLNWTRSTNRFDFTKLLALDRRGRPVAAASRLYVDKRGRTRTSRKAGFRRLARLRIDRSEGATFETLSVTKPKRATQLRYRVKATRLLGGDQVSSQASVVAIIGEDT